MYNLTEHQARFDRTRWNVFGIKNKISLRKRIIQSSIPKTGLYKCRIVYAHDIHSIECIPYHKRDMKSLKAVHVKACSYEYKWVERPALEELYSLREGSDEIIIIRDGLVTDGYYFNYVFEKNGMLYTPAQPLLPGTQRARLLRKGVIIEKDIRYDDLNTYSRVYAINAMNPLGSISFSMKDIC